MPQLCPQRPAPPRSTLLRASRRAVLLASAGLALTAGGATAATGTTGGSGATGDTGTTGGGAEAGAPMTPAPAPAATSAALSRATIRQVQRKLRVKPDGALGPRTRASLRRFQKRHHLPVDGRLQPATLAALGVTARAASAGTPAGPPATGDDARVLAAIAECESGGDPTRVSADGQYRGKYQFDQDTWEAAGGVGDPAAAPEAEQDGRAASLYAKRGLKPWPVCGPQAQSAAA